MVQTKTRDTGADPGAFLAAVEPLARRRDAAVLEALFRRVTGERPRMWGPTIVGYGSYHYRYASGHEGDACRVGFSPRKARHSLYGLSRDGAAANTRFEPLLARLGKHSRAVACLTVNKLADIDLAVLEELVALSWARSFEDWPDG